MPESIQWDGPSSVAAFYTTRLGGVSGAPWDSLNLAAHVSDQPEDVAENRRRLIASCEGLKAVQWLNQVHGTTVHRVAELSEVPDADASITSQAGLACAVLTADCLPVVFSDMRGRQVACAHAGWRGLLGGVLTNTLKEFESEPRDLAVWLGPCIRQPSFEVGPEVREAFVESFEGPSKKHIKQQFISSKNSKKYLCDLAGLATEQLKSQGVSLITDSGLCTYTDARFFSYRREQNCGRFATLIYKRA